MKKSLNIFADLKKKQIFSLGFFLLSTIKPATKLAFHKINFYNLIALLIKITAEIKRLY
jgi:hypothetical protein